MVKVIMPRVPSHCYDRSPQDPELQLQFSGRPVSVAFLAQIDRKA
jgi:hypothetical protein